MIRSAGGRGLLPRLLQGSPAWGGGGGRGAHVAGRIAGHHLPQGRCSQHGWRAGCGEAQGLQQAALAGAIGADDADQLVAAHGGAEVGQACVDRRARRQMHSR